MYVCVCKWLCGSAGAFTLVGRIWLFCTVGHSFWQSGQKVVCCRSSQHGSHCSFPIYYSYSCTQSLIHLRGLLAQTNLINIRLGNAFQNIGDIWFNLPGTQKASASHGIWGLVTSPLYFHFEWVCYWFIMHSLPRVSGIKGLCRMMAKVFKLSFENDRIHYVL